MRHTSTFFPPAETANEDGLLLFGGEVSAEWIVDAYRNGIFPWPVFGEDELMAWWSPDPRAIIEFDALRVSRRLARTIRQGRFTATVNRDFSAVIRNCASAGGRQGATWLTGPMIRAYEDLHDLGHAHSVEVWQDRRLAGGVYGVAIGGFFSAESMFFHVRDASKVALVYLVQRLQLRGYALLDIQQLTDHTARLGATSIPRQDYLRRLASAVEIPVRFSAG